jgi:hypothetical protein
MNEKFKQLIQEAVINKAEFDSGNYYIATPDEIEKFAELIVSECVNATYQSLHDENVFNHTPNTIRNHVMDSIKRHFGVGYL